MIDLCDYQEKAVRKLKDTTNDLLGLEDNKTIVLKAPTGSGKTVMVAEFLKELVEHRSDESSFAFLWMAPRKLHQQSKTKLEKYYADTKALRCVAFEDLIDRQIGDREILFLNWESINQADNIYIRENERDLNLSTVIQNTRDARRTIVLVIDESHFAATSKISQGIIAMFDPKISIEVSATPSIQGDETVAVYREHVIAEGMIKKSIAINPGFKNVIEKQLADEISFRSAAVESTNAFMLRKAIDKREQLAKEFEEAGAQVNPLLLVQLPDKREGEDDIKEEIIKTLEDNHDITLENGKLAIYLSEDKTNLENITRNDNEAEVMIFKQAIALGWDCPRAAILVLFRDWHSFTFSTQTLGRILRMPELKHYDNEELNTAFVFTNLANMSIVEDVAGNYLTIKYAKRKDEYQPISIRSVHPKRIRARTRLSPQFIRDFLQAANELGLNKKVTTDVQNISVEILSDGTIADVDEHIAAEGDHVQRLQNVVEIQKAFDTFVRDQLYPFFPEKRSMGRVKEAIYRFLQFKFPMEYEFGGVKAQILVLHQQNQQYFIDTINKAKEIYQQSIDQQERQFDVDEDWEVPSSLTFNHRFRLRDFHKSILHPFYEAEDASEPERNFAAFLNDTLTGMEWWYRNGDQGAAFFAVPYNDKGVQKPFYVDWIVKFTDGRIALFDTKKDFTAEIAKARAEGLAAYIKQENAKGKNLWGGIVVPRDGSWRYNDSEKYEYEPSLKGWKFLS